MSNNESETSNTLPSLSQGKASVKKRARPIEIAYTAFSLAILLIVSMLLVGIIGIGGYANSLFNPKTPANNPPGGSFSVIYVTGTIGSSSSGFFGNKEPSYLHSSTVNFVKKLSEDDGNLGILLFMNTPGGGVFESDELYHELESYKEKTGRPILAYMHSICASGGYYISMAANTIIANYNATTGSVGVYIQLTDTSGLFEKVGVETVLIRSGDNKGIGVDGVPITEAQRSVYQSIVDEKYDRFLSLVAKGRKLSENTLSPVCDGRPLTAQQALDAKMIDEINSWEHALETFSELTGGKPYYTNFSTQSKFVGIMASANESLPQGESATMFLSPQELPSAVPLVYAPGLSW